MVNCRKMTVLALAYIGLAGFFAGFLYHHYLRRISPTHAVVSTGQVYQEDDHGYRFYVTRQQAVAVTLLFPYSMVLFVGAVALNGLWNVVPVPAPRWQRKP